MNTPHLNPSYLALDFRTLEMEGSVDLDHCLHAEIVYLPADIYTYHIIHSRSLINLHWGMEGLVNRGGLLL